MLAGVKVVYQTEEEDAIRNCQPWEGKVTSPRGVIRPSHTQQTESASKSQSLRRISILGYSGSFYTSEKRVISSLEYSKVICNDKDYFCINYFDFKAERRENFMLNLKIV